MRRRRATNTAFLYSRPAWHRTVFYLKGENIILYLYKHGKSKYKSTRKSFSQIVSPGQEQDIAEYFMSLYREFGDVLTVKDIEDMTGLYTSTVLKMLHSGEIRLSAIVGVLLAFCGLTALIARKSRKRSNMANARRQ